MMTQDRSTGQPLAAPTSASTAELQSPEAPQVSPRNLNPAAPAFHQSAPASPKNLNPSAPVFRQSQSQPSEEQPIPEQADGASFTAVSPAAQGADSTDGDVEGGAPYLPNGGIEGIALEDKAGMEDPVPPKGSEEFPVGEAEEIATEEQQQQQQQLATSQEGYKYPGEMLAPVTKQMHYYFSPENLPNDKFLNGHMDSDKYIPLNLFLDFGRIKPICSSIDMLAQAVEASSYLELNETKDRVRVSQCRKTLTLRGFPGAPPVTEEEVKKFVLDIGAEMPIRIELVMVKDKLSTWYVTFRDMNAALNSFSIIHNKQAVYKGHNIGCCIKSSGTLGSSSYYPTPTPAATTEEQHHHHSHQQQRRLVVGGVVSHSQASTASGISTVAVTAPVPAHAVVPTTPSPMPQQPQQQQHQQQLQQAAQAAAAAAALLPQYQAMQLHPQFVSGSPTGIYYQQTSPSYMQYMPGMLAQGWPGAAPAMDPGILMQSNGLQPQIRSTHMPRTQIMPTGPGGPQHRFSRPQRVNRPNNSIDRSNSERIIDRQPPVVSVANLGGGRANPSQSGSYMHPNQHHHQHQQHRVGNSGANVREDVSSGVMNVSAVPQVVSAQQQQQYVAPLVSQQLQQQPHATANTTSGSPSVEASHYQHHHGQHPGPAQPMMVQGATGSSSSTSSSNAGVPASIPPHAVVGGSSNSGGGFAQSQMPQHHIGAHHHSQQPHHPQQQPQQHHHNQPPPPLPHRQQSQQPAQSSHHQHNSSHHHQNQPQQHHQHHQNQQHHQHHQQHHHQHSQQQVHHPQHPHNMQHNQPPPSQQNHHSHPPAHQQHHSMMQQPPPLHPQHIPPPPQHSQHPQGHQGLRKPRRRREDPGRNQRVERAHRANFSSQVPPVADNFTMEANSFPPLPGAANNVANSEVSHENRLADVVKGLPRVQGSVGSGGLVGPRGPSSTPSPVATPGLSTTSVQANHLHHSQQRGMGNQTADSDTSAGALDDADTASSSQEDADLDAGCADVSTASSESRANAGGRTDVGPASEPHSHGVMSRSNKASASAGGVSRIVESRHGAAPSNTSSTSHFHPTVRGPQPTAQPPLLSPTSVAAVEAPKPSYAQIAQKTANVAAVTSGSETAAVQAATTGQIPSTAPNSTVPTQNGPSLSVSSHQLPGNAMSTSGRNNSTAYNQSPNHGYQREHSGGNYRPAQHRGGSGGPKDNFQGSPQYQRPLNSNNNNVNHSNNNRRNAKDKFAPNNVNNKYDRRKPEARQK